MDHAIGNLKSYMEATLDTYQDLDLTKKEAKTEIKAYVDALNSLERYYYGKEETKLEMVLSRFEK